VDADGARPLRLGDVLTVPGILAWRPEDSAEIGGPRTRRQGGGVDHSKGTSQETFVARAVANRLTMSGAI
jgi:hypothetical protein